MEEMICRTNTNQNETGPDGSKPSHDLTAGLNAPQLQAVTHINGPLLVLAGPGSGKTRVVTRRVAHLARTVTHPRHILAITFTNKAAREMAERVRALDVGTGATVCTFHAFCAKLLRIHAEAAGVSPRFTIVDRDDRRKLLKAAIADSDLSTDNFPPVAAEQFISRAKNQLRTHADVTAAAADWRARTYARVYAQYEQLLSRMNGLDFDDLLMRTAVLLEEDATTRAALEDRYRYVLIDEYQDTNLAQYTIARQLTRTQHQLHATGDPDQSIYAWRGADIGNILTFEQDYPEAVVIRLEQNYRSTGNVLQAAQRLIAGNRRRKQKTLWTSNTPGQEVRLWETDDAGHEADLIARDITARMHAGVDPGEIAVFYRINALSRVTEEALMRHGIRYQVARGVEFYNRKEIKDVIAYLRVLINPLDEVSLLRIINTPPRGIGETTIRRLKAAAVDSSTSPWQLLSGRSDLGFLGRSAGKVHDFVATMFGLRPAVDQPPHVALQSVIRGSGLQAYHSRQAGMDDAPSDNLGELISAAADFHADDPDATLLDWLEYAALVSDTDAVDSRRGAITLMTLHAAKGLEFDVVYVIGLERGLLPFHRQRDEHVDDEEERRLCFVGMTRARKCLTLSHARYRMLRGVTERTVRSPFLDEIAGDGVQWSIEKGTGRPGRRAGQAGRLPDDIAQWEVGNLVRHPQYGIGQVLSLQRGPRRTLVDVMFKTGERHTWMLEFADLERVDFDDVG